MILVCRESLGGVETSVSFAPEKGSKKRLPDEQGDGEGLEMPPFPPTPQGFATSMGSKAGHCRAPDPCPGQKAQGRAQGSRGQYKCHLCLQLPAQQGSDPRGRNADTEDGAPELCAGRRRREGSAGVSPGPLSRWVSRG